MSSNRLTRKGVQALRLFLPESSVLEADMQKEAALNKWPRIKIID